MNEQVNFFAIIIIIIFYKPAIGYQNKGTCKKQQYKNDTLLIIWKQYSGKYKTIRAKTLVVIQQIIPLKRVWMKYGHANLIFCLA